MPLYEFIHDGSGDTIERIFPMGEAPQEIKIGKKKYRRNFAASQPVGAQVGFASQGYPYVSNRLPRNMDGVHCDSSGKPIIRTQQHEREIMAKHNLMRE